MLARHAWSLLPSTLPGLSAGSGSSYGLVLPLANAGPSGCLCVLHSDHMGSTQGTRGQSQLAGKWWVLLPKMGCCLHWGVL